MKEVKNILELNKIYNQDCLDGMKLLDSNSIDLTITSPPYDNLRTYNGYSFDFENIAKELYRITKDGGVIVWIVNDSTINGSETLTSFKQAIYFKEIGFNIETMIWEKQTFTATGALKYRYGQVFEYMFILSKNQNPKTFNPLKDREAVGGVRKKCSTIRQKDGSFKPISSKGKVYGDKLAQRFNIWKINTEVSNKKRCHPAQFPEKLAEDHIMSWSNEGDIVLDPFMGSGTTAVVCINTNRNYIGFEISKEYYDLANKRIENAQNTVS